MRIISLWLLLLALVPAAAAPSQVMAGSIVVTQCDDAGFTAALASAQAGDIITFNCGGPATIPLLSTKTLSTSLTIDGANNGHPVVFDGAAARRVFAVLAGSAVTLSNMTIQNGFVASTEKGGGINNAGFLTLSNVDVLKNSAPAFSGGGIYSAGALTVINSRVTQNASEGIYSASGTLVVQHSEISGNTGTGVRVEKDTATITGSTLSDNNGAGLSNNNGTINLSASLITKNKNDGAINSGGTLNVADSTFTENMNIFSNSGALANIFANVGVITVARSTFANNVSTAGASAIFAGNVVTVTDSLFTGNQTTGASSATISSYGSLAIVNSTLSGNSNSGSTNTAAILGASSTGNVSLTNVTIYNNTGAGITQSGGGLHVANSIVAANSGANCAGTITSGGYNLSDTGACPSFIVATPLLGPLGNNGGPTLTHMPVPGSPALDRIPASLCPKTDQRGVARPMPRGGLCDIGAVERQPTVYLPLVMR